MQLDNNDMEQYSDSTITVVDKTRDRILRSVTYTFSIITLPALFVSIKEALEGNSFIEATTYIGAYIVWLVGGVFLSRQLTYKIRATIILALLLVVGDIILMQRGLSGAGTMFLAAFCVMATVLLGLKYGVLAIAVSICSILLIGGAMVEKILPFDPAMVWNSTSIIAWVLAGGVFLVLSTSMVWTSGILQQRLQNTLALLKNGQKKITFQNVRLKKEIEEHKQADEALRESEKRYKRFVENAVVGVYQETSEGSFRFVNEKMAEMFGYDNQKQFLGEVTNVADLYACPEERPAVLREMDETGFIHGREVEFRKRGGASVWVALSTRKVKEEGKIFYEGLMHDITERKQIEAQLQQSQKMEAVGTLAGGIAHDFNNILAIILGNAELASDDVPDWNPASEHLKEIYRASIRAKDMVRQLLAFSRKSDEDSKPIDMAPIIKESMKMLRSSIPTSVEFKQHISDDSYSVMGDAAQINQIMMNLVINAADAMSEEGGLLEVTLENIILQEEKSFFDCVLSPGPYVRLRMRDTGEGIEPEIMERIFDPYYTTKEVGKGTGMGLSVIHGIVKRHGGGIRVESEIGKGTLFEVYFPALEETASEEKEPDGEIKGGSERILFVDDEESMVNLNRQRLERLGYQVRSTTKPVEALEWFKADPDQFDVIITDMTMPRMTGDRLAAEVLKIRPHMPVIICTGYSEKMSAKKAEALGVRKYIEKPIGLRNLASSLREVLEGK